MAPNLFLLREAALEQVRQLEVAKAQAYAREARALAELVGHFQGDSSVILELSGTARIGQIKAAGSCDRATRLVEGFPVALGLLEQGAMFVGTAELLLAVTKNCSERVRREVDRRLSGQVAGLDAADARARISAAVLEIEAELDLAEQQRRYAQARANRGVWVKPVEDGMARIGAEVDAVAAKEFALALEELDRAQKVEDDRCGVVRTKAQRMADVLAELPARHLAVLQAMRAGRVDELLGQALGRGTPGSGGQELPLDLPPAGPPRPWDLELDELVAALLRLPVRAPRTLNVHVAASTTLGLDHRACLVEGLGPLPGWLAPVLLPDAALRRVLVDRTTGLPLHLSDTLPPVLAFDGVGHRRRPDDPPAPAPDHPTRPTRHLAPPTQVLTTLTPTTLRSTRRARLPRTRRPGTPGRTDGGCPRSCTARRSWPGRNRSTPRVPGSAGWSRSGTCAASAPAARAPRPRVTSTTRTTTPTGARLLSGTSAPRATGATAPSTTVGPPSATAEPVSRPGPAHSDGSTPVNPPGAPHPHSPVTSSSAHPHPEPPPRSRSTIPRTDRSGSPPTRRSLRRPSGSPNRHRG